ncbi:MAG: hypothetical protein JSS83_07080 [Cyanobacteria bacterium SZAS LIN-3]|nr:hypothetical protein [Cyanobacteria bacterium SZAS LIN-3]
MSKKQEAKDSRNTNSSNQHQQKDVQKRYQQDFNRYQKQIERVAKSAECPKAA